MAYVFVENFAAGLDVRKPPIMGEPGSLIECRNCHIARGGFVESRKSIVVRDTLPAGQTKGLLGIRGKLMVFGIDDPIDVTLPPDVIYQQLTAGFALPPLARIVDAKSFDGRAYCIAEFTDGSAYHFYNGQHVTEFDEQLGITDTRTFDGVASSLADKSDGHNETTSEAANNVVRVTGKDDGTTFTLAASTDSVSGGTAVAAIIQNGAPAVAGVQAVGSFDVTGGVEGVAASGGFISTRGPVSPQGGPNPVPNGSGFTSIKVGSIELLSETVTQSAGTLLANKLVENINDNPDHTFTASYRRVFDIDPQDQSPLETYTDYVDLTGDPDEGASHNGPVTYAATGATFTVGTQDMASGVDPSYLLSILIGGFRAMDQANPVYWDTDVNTTAQAVRDAINDFSGTSGRFIGGGTGATVEISTRAETAEFNGEQIITALRNGFTTGSPVDMAGGVDAIPATIHIGEATYGGVFTLGENYTITIDGTNFSVETAGSVSKGVALLVHKEKVNVAVDSLVRYCAAGNPLVWDENDTDFPGAGFKNFSNNAAGSEELTGMAVYNGNLAGFAPLTTQVWFFEVDDSLSQILQTLENTGCVAPRTAINYSDTDTFYLDRTGVRSLRARDSSGNAFANDVGTAIDPLVSEYLLGQSNDTVFRAIAAVEPLDKRVLFCVGTQAFVFSYFKGAEISAWSTYDLAEPVDHAAIANNRLYFRSGDKLKVYGGESGDVYPEPEEVNCVVGLPFLDAQKPAHRKGVTSMDYGVEGDWRIALRADPNNLDTRIWVADPGNTITYNEQGVGAIVECSHFAPYFESNAGGHLKIFNLAVHYNLREAR